MNLGKEPYLFSLLKEQMRLMEENTLHTQSCQKLEGMDTDPTYSARLHQLGNTI